MLVVVVPGAVATLGYERHVGPLATDGTDRLIRYIFGTALAAPFSLFIVRYVWTKVVHVRTADQLNYTNRLEAAHDLAIGWLLLPIPYLLVPWLGGALFGRLR